uniref:DUF1768 domain-containing protein n=1 Tax=Parastrongyloides trichosuri TaxID=131310 RepID=A0A0N4ZVR5_PARTI
MKTDSPAKMVDHGCRVKGFVRSEWNEVRDNIMHVAIMLKFENEPYFSMLKYFAIGKDGRYIPYCYVSDKCRYWGRYVKLNDEVHGYSEHLLGSGYNKLGEILDR